MAVSPLCPPAAKILFDQALAVWLEDMRKRGMAEPGVDVVVQEILFGSVGAQPALILPLGVSTLAEPG